ncbi:thyrotropin releasing hormone [Eptesicus fuscus]|uniref:thyrotropin releasing hormone n=1 Tax=Eptesicus fuscus TaxID=29078 RepID=UPI0024041959|nr:thyrotropin releasing hormone [Eptesicus fuscus]
MPGPWLLLATALTLTLTGVPGGRAQPEEDPQDAGFAAQYPALMDPLRLLQQLRVERGNRESESQNFQYDGLSKRQHPGRREEEAEEGVEEEEEEGGAVGPHKRQHPGLWENAATRPVDVAPQKRQHPGRRSFWLGHTFTKRQHPGRRLVDPKAKRSWGEEEEEGEEGERELMLEKRQHPGKRFLGGRCGPQGDCGQASLLLGLLDDLSRGQKSEEKRQHPGRRATWARKPLEE